MLAGRPHEAVGNGSPRWMAAGPRSRGCTEPGLQAGSPLTCPSELRRSSQKVLGHKGTCAVRRTPGHHELGRWLHWITTEGAAEVPSHYSLGMWSLNCDRSNDARLRHYATLPMYRSDTSPHARRGDDDSQGGSVMSSGQLYDSIGATYTVTRRTEPRIAARVWAALGDARTVLNVGAGTGSYEPPGRDVIAVEPSALMRAQRPAGAAPCVAAAAESLPFEDQSFDAAMAIATVHHWQDPIAGLREMRRVARRVVVFTHDSSDTGWRRRFWLTRDYLPEVADLFVGRPSLTELARAIGARTEPVLIPWDCADGFFEAYWRRPEAYLDENVRRGISVWRSVGPDAEQRAVRSLRDDLASGRWAERNRDIVDLDAAELGLRLLVT
jgi:SAM-dependent methyltransferase